MLQSKFINKSSQVWIDSDNIVNMKQFVVSLNLSISIVSTM